MAAMEYNVAISGETIAKPQYWESYGSEIDVEKERTADNRPKMKFSLKRRLKDFGKTVAFSDTTQAEIKKSSVDFAPCEDKAFNLHMLQQNKNTQIVIETQDVICQTSTPSSKNLWTQYAPREFTEEKRNDILKSGEIDDFLKSAIPRLQDAMEQSEIFDVFKDDFEILGERSKFVDSVHETITRPE